MKKSATPSIQASGLFHRMLGVGERAENSLPVRKLMLAAAATFLGLFAIAQAQAADGAMTGVTLTSGSPGTLTVSWETPSPAPTDYRLRWAPADSDYLSWKDDNETDRGNAYPAGDATSLTLSGLSEGTEFKVQVRARYHKGEHKNSPWSGPWVEVQARVMSQPSKGSSAAGTRNSVTPNSSAPATPNLLGAAVTPEGHVMLVWVNPSDASITGYQVLRGPDAASLVVIEEDTGSSGTSYTDETPPAGQTHTYAVKARNATGLSSLSNTLTATVPAAEEEEELITASQTAADNTLVSNLGQTNAENAEVDHFGSDRTAFCRWPEPRRLRLPPPGHPGLCSCGGGWWHDPRSDGSSRCARGRQREPGDIFAPSDRAGRLRQHHRFNGVHPLSPAGHGPSRRRQVLGRISGPG